MSKILYVALRNKSNKTIDHQKIKKICEDLNPDNISARATYLHISQDACFGISNPSKTILSRESSVVLGKLFSNEKKWDQPGSVYPDGNYTIFRSNKERFEVATDILGTRCTWYYFDHDKFIASTSQTAIINYLGSFEFDKAIIPWIISTGSLGPSNAWDKRIRKVPSNGSVIIDKSKWTLSTNVNPVEFNPRRIGHREHRMLLRDALISTFSSINKFKNWNVTLSGGHDSRAILLLIKKFGKDTKAKLQTITWGEKEAQHDHLGDAYIAEKIAESLGAEHQFFSTELSKENIDVIVERFLHHGEGRIDHIAGYLDGFSIWQNLFENNVEGIIRGDEVFGYNKIYSPLIVNSFMGLTLCSDFANLKKYDYIKTLKQVKPSYLMQRKDETIHTWRDRIFQEYRIPYIQSALADLKYAFVEQINPFLSKEIVSVIRQLPDELRTNKVLFKRVMKEFDINIPYAKRDSNGLVVNIVKRKDMVDLIKKEFCSSYATTLFPKEFLAQVVSNLRIDSEIKKIRSNRLIRIVKQSLPLNFKRFLSQRKQSLLLDDNLLAFRILIICRMHRKLSSISMKSS